MRRLTALILCAALLLGGCGGIPSGVRAQLSEPDSYRTCTGTLTSIDTVDGVTLRIEFEDEQTVTAFLGGTPHPAATPMWFGFEVVPENQTLLEESGFFEAVEPGSTVTIRASSLIHMDADWFFLAELSCEGVEYLNFEEGFANVTDYLSKN